MLSSVHSVMSVLGEKSVHEHHFIYEKFVLWIMLSSVTKVYADITCVLIDIFFYVSKTRDTWRSLEVPSSKYTIQSLYALHHPLNESRLKRTNSITNLLQTKNGWHPKHMETSKMLGHSPIRSTLCLHLIGWCWKSPVDSLYPPVDSQACRWRRGLAQVLRVTLEVILVCLVNAKAKQLNRIPGQIKQQHTHGGEWSTHYHRLILLLLLQVRIVRGIR